MFLTNIAALIQIIFQESKPKLFINSLSEILHTNKIQYLKYLINLN